MTANKSTSSLRLPPSAFHLALADGSEWAIEAGDEQGAEVVARLGAAMRLGPCRCAARRLLVVGTDSQSPGDPGNDLVCALRPVKKGESELYVYFEQVSLVFARESQRRGGFLMHGALAERQGQGIILAAPGGTGKTTASSRLPHPWRSLCDDATLVVRDENGTYRAHPWPTWSRFADGGPGGSWDVQESLPLRAIFFLARSEDDRVEPVGAGHGATLLVESAEQLSRAMVRGLRDREKIRALRLERFDNICTLAKAVPSYVLQISLGGAFWEEIEQALA